MLVHLLVLPFPVFQVLSATTPVSVKPLQLAVVVVSTGTKTCGVRAVRLAAAVMPRLATL